MRRYFGFLFKSLITVIAISALPGCSTTNHGPLLTMAYHDITSKYNAQFNVKEKLKGTFNTISEGHKDNYDQVISVYDYTDPKETASYGSDLDDIMNRSTKAVQAHAVSNWSDDHFLLIGKAAFLKGEYEKAATSFKYITTEYKDGVDYVKVMKSTKGKSVKARKHKKKKPKKPKMQIVENADGTKTIVKEDIRPKRTLIIHDPARSEALVWLISTYTRMKKYSEANSVLTYVRNDDKFYKDYDRALDLVEADIHISSGNYDNAIEPLEKFLKATKRKKEKTRPAYALAQIYEKTSNFKQAVDNYKLVLKCNPSNIMEFNAKMRIAKAGRKSGGLEETKKLLAKLKKDSKFKDNWDQVYYELALINLEENNRDEAKRNFKKSIEVSVSNENQLALSYLKLAEMNYEEQVFVASKLYYDSTLNFLNKDDKMYPEIAERHDILKRMVEQLSIIEEQDSLIKLSKLSKAEQKKIVEKAKAEKEAQKEAEKESASAGKGNATMQDMNPERFPGMPTKDPSSSNNASAFYFYNTNARSTGYNQFITKWGRRKLEENWRRKDKSSVASSDETEEIIQETDTSDQKELNPSTLSEEDLLLEGIPNSPEQMKKANDKVAEAYYILGVIYKDDLKSYPKAQRTFEDVNTKYPNHKLLLESYYQLYLLSLKAGNNERANYYKGLILSQFPDSKIAKFLNDPNFLNELKAQENKLNDYYQSAYNDYSSNLLADASTKCLTADAQFKPNPLRWKFELLNALILSKENKLDEYSQLLNKIIQKSTDNDVKAKAQELLTSLNKSELSMIDLSKNTTLRDSLDLLYLPKEVKDSILQSQIQKPSAEDIIKGLETKTTQPKDSIITPVKKEPPFYSFYKYTENEPHLFVVFIKSVQTATANLQTGLNTFNSKNYSSAKLSTKGIALKSDLKLMVVRDLADKATAMSYYAAAVNDSAIFKGLPKDIVESAYMSKTNYDIFFNRKDVTEYLLFFNRFKDSIGLTSFPDLTPPAGTEPTKATTAAETKPKVEESKKEEPKKEEPKKEEPKKETEKPVANTPKETPKTDTVSAPKESSAPVFTYNENEPHQCIIWVKDGALNIQALNGKVGIFNAEKFAADRLLAKAVTLDANNRLIFIKPFTNKNSAMSYFTQLGASINVFDGLKPDQYKLFVISQSNYMKLIANKQFDAYFNFFTERYK